MLAIDFFKRGVLRFPDRTLVSGEIGTYSYAQMAVIAERIASALIREGAVPGMRVAIVAPNHPMILACQYGTMLARAVCAPANFRNRPDETLLQLNMQEISWLFFHSSMVETAELAQQKAPTIRRAICIDAVLPGFDYLADWIADVAAGSSLPAGAPQDPVYIMTSSGSTGVPKGVVHTNRSFESAIANTYAALPFDAPPRHLVVAPLSHAAGVFHWTMLALGGEQVLLNSTKAQDILAALEREKINVVFLPPTLIYLVLSEPDVREHDFSSLRYIVYGAAPMAVSKLKEAMEIFGPVLVQFYGQSEALLGATALTVRDHVEILTDPAKAQRIASVGRASPLVDVQIMSEEGELLGAGQRGEIVIRGGILMSHYIGNPAASELAGRHGWHHTGDIGLKDEDEFVYLVDRKADMIITGAFNVFPGEIEQVIMAHPAVQNCAVIGAPDEKWGECVLAAVEPRADATLDPAELIAFCKARLGSLKTPKRVEIWKAIPLNSAGKTLRREVRAHYWQGQARSI